MRWSRFLALLTATTCVAVGNLEAQSRRTDFHQALSQPTQADVTPDNQLQAVLERLEAAEAEIHRLRGEQQQMQQQLRQTPAQQTSTRQIQSQGMLPGEAPLMDAMPGVTAPEVDPLWGANAPRNEFDQGPFVQYRPGTPGGGRPTVRPKGRILADVIWYDQTEANRATLANVPDNENEDGDPDGNQENFTGFRQARIGLEGEAYQTMYYELEWDLAGDGRPDVRDMYIGFRDVAILGNVQVGEMKEDFSLEEMPSREHIVFMERSSVNNLVPSRSFGIKSFHVAQDGYATWGIGAYRAGGDDYGNSLSDGGDEAITGRVTYLPYYDEASNGRYFWHIGCGYSIRDPEEDEVRFRREIFNGFEDNGGGGDPESKFFVNTDNFDAEYVHLFNPETSINWGSLNVQAEYMLVSVERPGLNVPSTEFWAGYVQASYFLTGEYRRYRKERGTVGERIETLEDAFAVQRWPDRNLCFGRGAWQVAARLDHLDLDDNDIQGGKLTTLTLGLNWYLNDRTRFQFNYVRPWLQYQGDESVANAFGTRLSLYF